MIYCNQDIDLRATVRFTVIYVATNWKNVYLNIYLKFVISIYTNID